MASPVFELIGGVKFPAVGLGTAMLWDEPELEGIIDLAFENGYRHIDTAFDYKNEQGIGKVLKKWLDSGKLKREDIFVTTKLPSSGVHPERVEKYLEKSLRNLQLDYIDLYLIHFPVCIAETGGSDAAPEPTDLIAVWKKLEEQVKVGKCRAIGVSNFNQEQVSRIISNSIIKPAANEVELHVYLQQTELVNYCQENNVVMISYFSLRSPRFVMKERRGDVQEDVIKNIAEKYNKTTAQIMLKFLVQKNIAIIPKSSNEKRLKENIDLFKFTLDQDDMKAIEALDQGEAARKSRKKGPLVQHPEYPWK